jgi:uncharacterized glyoxalase superfamily protein PhnB
MKHYEGEEGTLNTTRFLIDFFQRGFERKNALRTAWRKKQAKKIEERIVSSRFEVSPCRGGTLHITLDVQVEEQKKKEEADMKNGLKVEKEYGQADFDSALKKITDAAIKYDK